MPDPPADRVRPPAVLLRPTPIVCGILAGAAAAVLLQQFAVAAPTLPLLLLTVLAGVATIGIALPTLLVHVIARHRERAPREVPE